MESIMVIDITGQDIKQGYPKVLHDLFTKFSEETRDRYFDLSIPEAERKAATYNLARDFIGWLAKGSMPNVVVPKITKLQNNISSQFPAQE